MRIFLLLSLAYFSGLGSLQSAHAAVYSTNFLLLSGSLSYDVIDPKELNGALQTYAPLQGIIAGRLKLERGLISPDWTHWRFEGQQSA